MVVELLAPSACSNNLVKESDVLVRKLVPVMVTLVPPARAPEFGEMVEMVGVE